MCKNKENITWTNNKVAPQHVFSISTYSHVWVSVKRGWRMTDADGKMRIEKCGWKKMWITKKVREKKREMRMAEKEKNKLTNN